MKNGIYHRMAAARANRRKKLVVLIDPDKATPESLVKIIEVSVKGGVDYFFVGGSLLLNDAMPECIDVIKSCSEIPVIIFPGSPAQICPNADALLLLSLISGRNPELLIGQHVTAAPALRESRLEIIPAGYLLVDGGSSSTVTYLSNTNPIPRCKPEIAMATAMAGEMLGLKVIYLEAGSGAADTVTPEMVTLVSSHVEVPVIVGGGIRSPAQALELCRAGADVIVIGTIAEKDPEMIPVISNVVHAGVAV